MGFVEAVRSCFRQYFGFSGRAPRSEYWFFALFYLVAAIVLAVIDVLLFGVGTPVTPLTSLFGLGVVLPSLAVAVRRLHDIDRSGWWLLLYFVPLIGVIVLIIFAVRRGTAGPNRFGPDPLAA